MTKLGLGTIGTSMITEQFVEAAKESGLYTYRAVYSRHMNTANTFKDQYGAESAYDDFEAFLNDEAIDVIYVASPNSLHFSQAKEALMHGKHAIVEKPMITSLEQWAELTELAKSKGVVVVEAARHIFEPNFVKLTKMIQDFEGIYGATLTYAKYSSRFDNVLAGEEPPIFSPKFGGGAANDLGIYTVYAALSWFGKPDSVHAFSQKIQTGVDGKGTVILRYPDFDVTLQYGKMITALAASEVYSLDKTLVLDAITGVEKAELVDARTRESQEISMDKSADNPLIWEAKAFAKVMTHPEKDENKAKLDEWLTLSYNVHEVLEEIRQQS
ncbi:MAG: Gfo/Idh/MocA family oxidoreductase [Alkalibacterium sp.]|uniref:Oxidoreductase family, NAD-binding Rossmann fold n=1 Tax=Alkalibacterium gilvum TaxID=1130080 RepID=A0A1H6RG78_9LACT|nr:MULTISPECIES: Gfo/Idh/MocA family oxidoreductase [Alkalibacterium]MDN6296240.1 Gfo/Idh/MocA family oxidoreductase [Alkalibacterium sp.]SEI53456.1 Oxidoreductase family, NAD-binding Rossmann fold [Alkalibacterium gilvum]